MIVGESTVSIPASSFDVPKTLITDTEVSLPFGVVGIARGEPLCNLQSVGKGLERAVAVASGFADIADFVIADGEVSLPFGVAGIARGEGVDKGLAALVMFEGGVAISKVGFDVA